MRWFHVYLSTAFRRYEKKVGNIFFVEDLVKQILERSSVIRAGDKLIKIFMQRM